MTRVMLTGLLLALLAAAQAGAEELVYFKNGQAMRVDKTRREGKWMYIAIGDDGEMGVLLRQIAKVENAPPLPSAAHGGAVSANLVSPAGAGGGYVAPAPIAEAYEAPDVGDEPGVVQPSPEVLQQQAQQQIQQQMQAAQAAQGTDLVPRSLPMRRGDRQQSRR